MKIPPGLIVPPLHCLYRLWTSTLRIEEIGRSRADELVADGHLLVTCLWHDEMFSLIHTKRNLKLAAIVSRSKDGEYLAKVMEKLGFYPVRGSSSRGGAAALRGTVSAMRKHGLSVSVTVDGPRGPRHQIKDGALFLAHFAKALIVPVRAFNSRALRFGSWDKFQLPLPFSRTRLVWGEPYEYEAPDAREESLALERAKLMRKMDNLEAEHAFK